MADGIEARARRLKQLKRDLGVPAVRPKPVHVELFDQFLEPLGPLAQGEGTCPPGAICFNVTVVPSGLFIAEGTRWLPTGETQLLEIDGEMRVIAVGRQVPNLVRGDAWPKGEPKPSRVDDPSATGVVMHVEREERAEGVVTAAEIAAARAEAKAMRDAEKVDQTTPEERRIWGGIASRRTDRRIDTSWLWPPMR